MQSQIYETKVKKLTGTSYGEVYAKAKFLYKKYSSKTKRRPYIRSKFFKKEKVFLDLFWVHLAEKNKSDRLRKLIYFACALDLIEKTYIQPESKDNPNKKYETVHRFNGINSNGDIFYVQIKEVKRNGEKSFISVFPANHP